MAERQTDRIRGRLSGVRKRKRARKGFASETLALKMRLVRVQRKR
jgi:hypothetical protein